jgi:hypothetical protein
MRFHTGDGIGGAVALVLAIFAGIASPFLLSGEVGRLYERSGRPQPVTAVTGLWALPVYLLTVLPIYGALGGSSILLVAITVLSLGSPVVWFVRTNSALNAYWQQALTAPAR